MLKKKPMMGSAKRYSRDLSHQKLIFMLKDSIFVRFSITLMLHYISGKNESQILAKKKKCSSVVLKLQNFLRSVALTQVK